MSTRKQIFAISDEEKLETLEADFSNFKSLQALRKSELNKLNPELKSVVILRDKIYKDFFSWHRKRSTVSHYLSLTFTSENAVRDGTGCNAYSAFYLAVYSKFDGKIQMVPNQLLDEGDLQLIGKIIHNGCIQFKIFSIRLSKVKIFSIRLSKVTLKQYLVGDVSSEELVQSFLEFLTSKEKELTLSFREGKVKIYQSLTDIFHEYSIFEIPTGVNINVLLLKVAKSALIKILCFQIQNIVSGMGGFWKKITPEMLDLLYECRFLHAKELFRAYKPWKLAQKIKKL